MKAQHILEKYITPEMAREQADHFRLFLFSMSLFTKEGRNVEDEKKDEQRFKKLIKNLEEYKLDKVFDVDKTVKYFNSNNVDEDNDLF